MTSRCLGWLLLAVPVLLSACGSSGDTGARSKAAALDEPSFGCEGYPRWTNGKVVVCEAREYTALPTSGTVKLRPSYAGYSSGPPIIVVGGCCVLTPELPSGSLRAAGIAGDAVTLRAYVFASDSNEARAREVAAAVVVHTDYDDFYATGPDRARVATVVNPGSDWVVSLDADLPYNSNVNAQGSVGPTIVQDLSGTMTLSGGVMQLARLSGSIIASGGSIQADDLDGTLSLVSDYADIDALRLSGNIVLQTSTGRITAEDLDGDSRLTTSAGEIHLSRVRGTVTADLSSGLLQAEDVDGKLDFVSSDANVKLSRIGGSLSGQTSSGSIELDLAGSSWNGAGADLSTSSGSVTLRAPTDYSALFDFFTSSGYFSSDFSGNSFRGPASYSESTGHGGTRLSVYTESGDISLLKQR